MIDFLSGAVTLAFLLAGLFFLRFYKKTRDRLFLTFAIAFGLFAVNQLATFILAAGDERSQFSYILRVLGFLLILAAIVDKNTTHQGRRK